MGTKTRKLNKFKINSNSTMLNNNKMKMTRKETMGKIRL